MSEFDERKRNQDKNKIKKKNRSLEDEIQHKIFRGNMLIQQQVTLGQY